MPKTGVLAEPPLIGRERELQELDFFLDSAVEGNGKTVFVSGEAGSGKTRLVTEFLNAIKKEEVTVLSSSCLSDVAVPYFPFMEAFGTYFSTHKDEKQEPEIKSWFTGPSQTKSLQSKESLTPQAWKDLTFVAITNALTSMASKKPIILFIEDIHWADSASLSLLHYVSRGIRTSRAFVLATYRSKELTIDAEGKAHPLC